MGLALKYGQMELNTRETGTITKLMDGVNFGTQMGMCMKESGLMTKLMAMVFTFT
jgi:hypothetical protein